MQNKNVATLQINKSISLQVVRISTILPVGVIAFERRQNVLKVQHFCHLPMTLSFPVFHWHFSNVETLNIFHEIAKYCVFHDEFFAYEVPASKLCCAAFMAPICLTLYVGEAHSVYIQIMTPALLILLRQRTFIYGLYERPLSQLVLQRDSTIFNGESQLISNIG